MDSFAAFFEWNETHQLASIFSPVDHAIIWKGHCDSFAEALEISESFKRMFRHGRASAFSEASRDIDQTMQRFQRESI